MRNLLRFCRSLSLAASMVVIVSAQSAENPLSPSVELKPIADRITENLRQGERADPADLKALDDLMIKYADDKSEAVGQIALIKAAYIMRVERDEAAAFELLKSIAADFPGTRPAEFAARLVGQMEQKMEAEAVRAQLVGNAAPELNFTWATDEQLSLLSDLKGKVVVLDFWATWCGPCVRSFPQVRELTDYYANSAVEVVGVTSLQGSVHGLESTPINTRNDPNREHALMADYIVEHDINWTIAFSEQKVFNPDYGITGIPHMAIVAPDGTLRHVGLHPAMPHAEKVVMIDAILEEFDLPVPAKS
jgi:thiol-disulfide isomerase/thioredoxin